MQYIEITNIPPDADARSCCVYYIRALSMDKHWNHNIHYHRLVLSALPSPCGQALDIGCGEGLLTQEIALSCEKIIGIDTDPNCLKFAILNNQHLANLIFIEGDIMSYPLQPETFDMITSIATLHHLPLGAALTRFRDLLAPGGTLIIIGLYRQKSITDYFYALLGLPLSWTLRRIKPYRQIEAPVSAPNQTLNDVRYAAKKLIPGAKIRRELLFRYSLVWKKPVSS